MLQIMPNDLCAILLAEQVKGENMNIKLHNKYEITVGDKHHTAYNTITYNIFDAIVSSKLYKFFILHSSILSSLLYIIFNFVLL